MAVAEEAAAAAEAMAAVAAVVGMVAAVALMAAAAVAAAMEEANRVAVAIIRNRDPPQQRRLRIAPRLPVAVITDRRTLPRIGHTVIQILPTNLPLQRVHQH